MELRIYNTLTKQKEIFNPLKAGEVSMYVCGVTVYDAPHLGHARAYVAFDVIYRFLESLGYKVKYVRNITDIDDKIIQRAKEEINDYESDPKRACTALAIKYARLFREDMDALKVLSPSVEPKATENIDEIIRLIESLIQKGYAYLVDGNVYFRISAFKEYGMLSGRNVEEMELQSRIDTEREKENPLDFALWKKRQEGEPYWESPFGEGRPGWHIECSAMSMKYLGATFDIHGGGQDLIFPHHENELAQSKASSSEPFARYWIHNGFITVQKEKMSKSLKNFKTVRDLLTVFPPMHLRFYLISTHYRSPLDFSDHLIKSAAEGLQKIENTLSGIKVLFRDHQKDLGLKQVSPPEEFTKAMCDDFNTPKALSIIFNHTTEANKIQSMEGDVPFDRLEYCYNQIMAMLKILGIEIQEELVHTIPKSKWCKPSEGIFLLLKNKPKKLSDEQVSKLVSVRADARNQKNFDLSDRIREYLESFGVEIRDQADICYWKYK